MPFRRFDWKSQPGDSLAMARILGVMIVAGLLSALLGCSAQNVQIGLPRGGDQQKQIERQLAMNAEEPPGAAKLPEMTDAGHERLGDDAARQGNFQLAMIHYEKASAENPNNLSVRYKKGVLLLSRGMNDAAAAEFQELLKRQPDHAFAHEGIGQARFAAKQYNEAEKHFRKALQLNPRLWKPHAFLGIAFNYQNRPAEAVSEFTAALRIKPDEGILYNNLGVAYSLMGNHEKAVEAFQKASRTAVPNKKKIYNNLGVSLCELGRWTEAQEAFKQGGSEAQAYNNLGCMLLKKGEIDKAITLFEKALEVSPGYYDQAAENLKRASLESYRKGATGADHTASARIETIEIVETDIPPPTRAKEIPPPPPKEPSSLTGAPSSRRGGDGTGSQAATREAASPAGPPTVQNPSPVQPALPKAMDNYRADEAASPDPAPTPSASGKNPSTTPPVLTEGKGQAEEPPLSGSTSQDETPLSRDGGIMAEPDIGPNTEKPEVDQDDQGRVRQMRI